MRIRFWGTRGSIAKPGPSTVRYGGNTSCVEVRADNTLFVLDCGTGAHELGQQIVAANPEPVRGHLLISHTHWDHIQGFPFFAPLFSPGSEWDIYAPRQRGRTLEEILAGQMQYTYFPVPLGELAATIRYHELTEGEFEAGGVHVVTRYLNHPAPVLGYRLEAGGVAVVYATDHEPYSRHHTERATAEGPAPVHAMDKRHIEFLANADLVIHDAQYTLEEYPRHLSWGHCPAEWAVDFAVAAHAKRLALYHHDPSRDDRAVESLLSRCRKRAAAQPSPPEVFAAAEGQYLVVVRPGAERIASGAGSLAVADSPVINAHETTILVADDDPDVMAILLDTLEAEGFRVISAANGDEALAVARAERPDVIVLDWMMPGLDGLAVCRALRADPEPRLAQVPVVLITGRTDATDTAAGFDAGVTDYLTKPFKPSVLLTRLHAWLERAGAGRTASPPAAR